MTKRILITGAAGFIGFHAAKALQRRGDQVIGLDNFNSYYPVSLKRARESELRKQGIKIYELDISAPGCMQELFDSFAPTHILHLAAQAGVRYSLEEPQAYIRSNIQGFVEILELCRKNPAVKLIYASSSSVYGESTTTPFTETAEVNSPVSLYGATKRTNELFASTYRHLFGISSTALRYFTVYGPWGRPDMAYFLFTQAILEGRPIPLFNRGEMLRDFTYVDDAVQGTLAAIDLGAEKEVFNIGSHKPIPLLDFVKTLEEVIGIPAKIEHKMMQQGDVTHTYADIAHSQKRLGFNPVFSLKEGLQHFFDWYQTTSGHFH